MNRTVFLSNTTIKESDSQYILTSTPRDSINTQTVYTGDDFPKLFGEAQRDNGVYYLECTLWKPTWTVSSFHGAPEKKEEWYLTNDPDEIKYSIIATDTGPRNIEYNKIADHIFIELILHAARRSFMAEQARNLEEITGFQ